MKKTQCLTEYLLSFQTDLDEVMKLHPGKKIYDSDQEQCDSRVCVHNQNIFKNV